MIVIMRGEGRGGMWRIGAGRVDNRGGQRAATYRAMCGH